MRGRIKKKTRDKFRRRIRDVVIGGLGRPLLVYKQPIKSQCFNCYYDKLTNKSTGTCKWLLSEALQKQQEYENNGGVGTRYSYFVKGRCPVCKGNGYLKTARKVWVKCKITWDPSSRGYGNNVTYTSAGTIGSTVVEIKAHPRYFELFKNSERIIVDNCECKLSKPPMTRGLGNDSLLIITAFTTEKLSQDLRSNIKEYSFKSSTNTEDDYVWDDDVVWDDNAVWPTNTWDDGTVWNDETTWVD